MARNAPMDDRTAVLQPLRTLPAGLPQITVDPWWVTDERTDMSQKNQPPLPMSIEEWRQYLKQEEIKHILSVEYGSVLVWEGKHTALIRTGGVTGGAHMFHAVMTLLTLGLWSIAWATITVLRRTRHLLITVRKDGTITRQYVSPILPNTYEDIP